MRVNGIDLTKYVKKSDYDTKVGKLELEMLYLQHKIVYLEL